MYGHNRKSLLLCRCNPAGPAILHRSFAVIQGEDFGAFSRWDAPDSPPRTASELVNGLEATWQVMQEALARFTPAGIQENIQTEHRGQTYTFTRGWVVWHVIEHDLHHGGEIAYSLGMHGLKAPDI